MITPRWMRALVVTSALTAASTAPAHADWLFTPFIGVAFAGDAEQNKVSYGFDVAWMSEDALGIEADFSHTPGFFDETAGGVLFDDNGVTTFGVNALVGIPFGQPPRAGRFSPYLTGGAGLIRQHATDPADLFGFSRNDFGVNVGTGAFAFFSEHIALRGDVRYFRSLEGAEDEKFNFWRATAGLTIRD
ncbi:MAG: porin family protein [Vicinamibacteraceae bacterium]